MLLPNFISYLRGQGLCEIDEAPAGEELKTVGRVIMKRDELRADRRPTAHDRNAHDRNLMIARVARAWIVMADLARDAREVAVHDLRTAEHCRPIIVAATPAILSWLACTRYPFTCASRLAGG